jgi:hypothetical protein
MNAYEPWKDIDPAMIAWDRKRKEAERERREPIQIPLYDEVHDEDNGPVTPARKEPRWNAFSF